MNLLDRLYPHPGAEVWELPEHQRMFTTQPDAIVTLRLGVDADVLRNAGNALRDELLAEVERVEETNTDLAELRRLQDQKVEMENDLASDHLEASELSIEADQLLMRFEKGKAATAMAQAAEASQRADLTAKQLDKLKAYIHIVQPPALEAQRKAARKWSRQISAKLDAKIKELTATLPTSVVAELAAALQQRALLDSPHVESWLDQAGLTIAELPPPEKVRTGRDLEWWNFRHNSGPAPEPIPVAPLVTDGPYGLSPRERGQYERYGEVRMDD